MRLLNGFVRQGRWAALLVIGAVVVGAGVHHAWTCQSEMVAGVHFNSVVPDFGVPPQVAVLIREHDAPLRPGTLNPYGYNNGDRWDNHDYEAEQAEQARAERRYARLVRSARAAEKTGRYRTALKLYRTLFEEGRGTDNYWRDRVEVLQEAVHKGAPARFQEYLDVRNRFDRGGLWPEGEAKIRARLESIAADPKAGFLRAHALYTVASMDWARRQDAQTAARFAECAKLYPESPRTESAMIMAARTILGLRTDGTKPTQSELALGRSYAATLLTRYPGSRFKANALGWIGRAEYLSGRYGSARAFYRRQLAAGGPPFGTTESIVDCYRAEGRGELGLAAYLAQYRSQKSALRKTKAVRYVLGAILALRPDEVVRLCRMLREDMGLLQPYLECRLYFSRTNPNQLDGMIQLAQYALRRSPKAKLSPAVWARLSEIGYLQKRYPVALRFARKAIAGAPRGAVDLDLAYYVQGSALTKLGRRPAARRSYETLLQRYPKSRLAGGARENLALIYERLGLPTLALNQYFALRYDDDVAYMLDVRLSTAQIQAFIQSCHMPAYRRLATFALGMRFLRKDQFNKALREFAKLTKRQRLNLAAVEGHDKEWWVDRYGDSLYDPVRTATDLRKLHAACGRAKGAEQKARAIYAVAAYYRKQGTLVLYNASLWQGRRFVDSGWYWNRDEARPGDAVAWRKHFYEHDSYARARALCLEIVRRYPRTSVAPKAAYTAATSTYRLSNLNDFWRDEDQRKHLGAQAVRLMKLVVSKYPKSKLRKAALKYGGVYAAEVASRHVYVPDSHPQEKTNSAYMTMW